MEPGFWQNKTKAEKILKEKKIFEELVNSYKSSQNKLTEIIDLYELALEENNEVVLKDAENNFLKLYKNIKKMRLSVFYLTKLIFLTHIWRYMQGQVEQKVKIGLKC